MTYPTKDQLENDYFVLNMSQDQIAQKYGHKTRQVIGRLFKKYGIKSKSKSELAIERDKLKNPIPKKETLEKLYEETNSLSEIARILNVSRKKVSDWMSHHDIKVTYFKNDICNDELFEELHFISVKEASIKYGISTYKIKVRVPYVPKVNYTKERIKEIISLYDTNNQGFSKAISLEDENVYNTIINLTSNHYLYGDKITEKVYRIIHDFEPNDIPTCKSCGVKIKFYTMELGYGNSDLQICSHCVAKQSAVSKPSQELFWKIYNKLTLNDCYFSELNYEKTVVVTESDKIIFKDHKKLNKTRYVLDFVCEDKVIEFDGRYWHSDEEKEIAKDLFLGSKGLKILHVTDVEYNQDPQETLNKCIRFLTQ